MELLIYGRYEYDAVQRSRESLCSARIRRDERPLDEMSSSQDALLKDRHRRAAILRLTVFSCCGTNGCNSATNAEPQRAASRRQRLNISYQQ